MNDEVKAINLDDRCEAPGEDDSELVGIEITFAIPVQVTPEQRDRLYELLNEIASSPKNTPKEGVHWLSFSGAKLNLSAVDAALLGMPVGDNPPANGEEPGSDSTVLCFGTSARSFNSDKEREKYLRRRQGA